MVSGWGEGHAVYGAGQARGKRLDLGESGSDLKDVNGLDVVSIICRHNPERFIDRPEV